MPDAKRCSSCAEILPLQDFARRTASPDGRQPRCRACWRAWYVDNKDGHVAEVRRRNALRARRNRELLTAHLLDNPCVDCGETDLRVLDLDHRDRALKRDVVSRLVFRAPWETVAREIALCDVRCANCHRRRTAQQLGWWSALADDDTTSADDHARALARLAAVLG